MCNAPPQVSYEPERGGVQVGLGRGGGGGIRVGHGQEDDVEQDRRVDRCYDGDGDGQQDARPVPTDGGRARVAAFREGPVLCSGCDLGGHLFSEITFLKKPFYIPVPAYHGEVVGDDFLWKRRGNLTTAPRATEEETELGMVMSVAVDGFLLILEFGSK